MEKLTLAQVRGKLGLRQDEFARKIGVCPATLSFWETGKRSPKYSKMVEICKLSGMKIEQIDFGGKEQE